MFRNKRRLRTLLALILLSTVLQGCSQSRYAFGPPLSRQQTPTIAATPTLTEVLGRLGPPMRISAMPNGFVMAWEHWRINEDSLGISLGLMGADMLSADWASARTSGTLIVALFDHQRQLKKAVFSDWDTTAGGGRALQPFIGVSLIDVDDLGRAMPQHRWGALSLDILPTTLNSQSRPDTGQAGIAQRGTPSGAGQRSLEMR